MFKVGDKILFSNIINKEVPSVKSTVGIVLGGKNERDLYPVLALQGTFNNHVCNLNEDRMILLTDENLSKEVEYITNYYENLISDLKSKLKKATNEEKQTEKDAKYKVIKNQIMATAKHMLESDDDIDFENKLKEIALLKKNLFEIELDCKKDARKHNGVVRKEIEKARKEYEIALNKLDMERIDRVFKQIGCS